jgi:hypothetical protein
VVEEALELLVGVVYAQLLEGVYLEDLEAEDVQDADEVVDGCVGVEVVIAQGY